MADFPLHFQNNTGNAEIFIGVKKFMCAGAAAPNDHPHVFLTMAEAEEKLCPYCSTLYRFDAALPAGATRPVGCLLTAD